MRGIKNITVNYDNGEIETLNKGVVVSFDEIDNEEETIKVRYRMCDIKGKDLHLIVNAVVALAQQLGLLNEDYICKLYDINDAQRDKIRFTISQTKPLIDVEDCSADETPAEMWDISIIYDGKVMLPISTAEGLMFIDRVYLNPFVDMPNETMALALRKDFKGTPYFAVKFGMIAYGFICAYEIVDEDFVRQLKSLYIESDMILKNEKG